MIRKTKTKDDLITIISNISAGNPGAMQCLTELARFGQHRPLAFAYGVIMFDALRLRGASIYMLWNDCLHRNTGDLVTLIDLWKNDAISSEKILKHVNAEGGRGLPLHVKKEVLNI